MRGPRTVAVVLLVASLLSLAGDAAARKFQMSGTWVMRTGRLFIPLQFATHAIDSHGAFIHASMGNLTAALGPNGPILGEGGLTATGSAPATLRRYDPSFTRGIFHVPFRIDGDLVFGQYMRSIS